MNSRYADEKYVQRKIAELCATSGIPESKISLDLGRDRTYINKINAGKRMPSVGELMYICQYFKITPEEFFRTDAELVPLEKREIIEDILSLPVEDVKTLKPVIERLKQK